MIEAAPTVNPGATPSPSYAHHLDEVLAFAGTDVLKGDLLAAKAEFFAATGEVREEDRAFEPRMALMLEYFLFDRPLAARLGTPAELYVEEQARRRPAEEVERLRAFTRTRHALFEVRKFLRDGVRLRDTFTGQEHEVFERRKLAGLSKGDLFDARLVPFDGRRLFSSAFCFHPSAARAAIVKEIKRRRVQKAPIGEREVLWTLAKMALKVERYRNVSVENIYRFDGGGL